MTKRRMNDASNSRKVPTEQAGDDPRDGDPSKLASEIDLQQAGDGKQADEPHVFPGKRASDAVDATVEPNTKAFKETA